MAGLPSPFATNNQLNLIKIETTPGTDAAPDLTNVALCEAPGMDPNVQTQANPEVTGSFSQQPAFFTGAWRAGTARVQIKGSRAAGTTPPDWSPWLACCSMPFTNLSAAVTGTLAAAGANTATLAAGASTTDNAYRGMVLQLPGRRPRVIVSYVGSTKVATVSPKWIMTWGDGTSEIAAAGTETYTIPPGTLFSPSSTAIPSLTWKRYLKNRNGGNASLQSITGWQGSAALAFARGGNTVTFTGQGDYNNSTDVSWPGAPTFLNTNPPPFINGIMALDDVLVRGMLNMDISSQVTTDEDVNATFGYSGTTITGRRATGSIRLPHDLQSTRDVMGAVQVGSQHVIVAIYGSVAGNRVAFMNPTAVYTGHTYTDVNGVIHDTIPLAYAGADTEGFLYLF